MDWLGRELDQGVMRCGLKWKTKMLLGVYNASFKCLLGTIFINGRRECFGNIQPNSASMRHVFDLGLCRYVSPTSADTLLLSSAHCVSPFRPRKLFSYRLVQIRSSHCHKSRARDSRCRKAISKQSTQVTRSHSPRLDNRLYSLALCQRHSYHLLRVWSTILPSSLPSLSRP